MLRVFLIQMSFTIFGLSALRAYFNIYLISQSKKWDFLYYQVTRGLQMPYSTFKLVGEVSQKFDIEVRTEHFIDDSVDLVEY